MKKSWSTWQEPEVLFKFTSNITTNKTSEMKSFRFLYKKKKSCFTDNASDYHFAILYCYIMPPT